MNKFLYLYNKFIPQFNIVSQITFSIYSFNCKIHSSTRKKLDSLENFIDFRFNVVLYYHATLFVYLILSPGRLQQSNFPVVLFLFPLIYPIWKVLGSVVLEFPFSLQKTRINFEIVIKIPILFINILSFIKLDRNVFLRLAHEILFSTKLSVFLLFTLINFMIQFVLV